MLTNAWLEFAALVVAFASFAMTYLRTVRMHGGEQQRIRALEEAILKLATAESVAALGSRLDGLEGEVKLVATALTKVAVLEMKLDGLDRLMTRELDEIKHAVRGLGARGQDIPATQSRRRRAADS